MTYRCLGKNEASAGLNLGVDNIILPGPALTAWTAAAETQAPRVPAASIPDLAQVLASDPDPVLRGLAALSFAIAVSESARRTGCLDAGLQDVDVSVRMMSANALTALGQRAPQRCPR